MPSWHHINEIVFGPAIAPAVGTTGYNQLDLSAHVPNDERAGVVLIIEDLTSGSNYYGVRPSDDTDDHLDPTDGPHGLSTGMSIGSLAAEPAAVAVISFTGPTGIVSWVAQNAQSTKVTLAGWFSVGYENVLLFDPAPIIPPNTWQEIPGLAAAIGYTRKLAFIKFLRSVGSPGAVGMRLYEPIGGGPPNWEPDKDYAGGSTIGQNDSANLASMTALRTGVTGLAEWQSTAPSPLVSAWLKYCVFEPWITVNQKVWPSDPGDPYDAPPTTWTNLLLSQYFGNRNVLVALEVRHEVGPLDSPNQYVFRNGVDNRDYLGSLAAEDPGGMNRVGISRVTVAGSEYPRRRLVWVESDTDGIIQWKAESSGYGAALYFYGWIEGAIGTRFSLLGSPFEPDYVVEFSLEDDTQVVLSSINFWLTDPHGTEYHVIIDGAFSSPWDGTIVSNGANGYDIEVTTIGTTIELYIVGVWTAVVEAQDTGSGSIRTEWEIPIDTASPALTVSERFCEEVITLPYSDLRFRIEDQWGFDQDTLRLELVPAIVRSDLYPEVGTKQLVIEDGSFQSPYSGLIQENGLGGIDVTIRNIPQLYSPCRWEYRFDGQSIVEKELDEDSLQ